MNLYQSMDEKRVIVYPTIRAFTTKAAHLNNSSISNIGAFFYPCPNNSICFTS